MPDGRQRLQSARSVHSFALLCDGMPLLLLTCGGWGWVGNGGQSQGAGGREKAGRRAAGKAEEDSKIGGKAAGLL